MIIPRDYQYDAVNAIWQYFTKFSGHPLVLMPTGTGKSVVIGEFARSALHAFPSTRIMIGTHVETLITQNYAKLMELWPTAPAGIYSAGVGRRDTFSQITFVGIQSVFDRASEFVWVDILMVDECHLISPEAETMYRRLINSLLAINPNLKIIGFTATGWRLGSGELVGSGIFTDIAIDMTTPAAWNWFIDMGYLVPLSSKKTRFHLDANGVKVTGGEFNMGALQTHVDTPNKTRQAVHEIMQWGVDRARWMVFASGVNHCEHISEMFQDEGISSVAIHNKSKKPQDLLAAYKEGHYRCAVSMNKLTTGVDIPEIDLIGVLRHTKSSSLWVQMLGRGTRPWYAPGYDLSTVAGRLASIGAGCKARGTLVLDFARNTESLGPINDPKIPPKKKPSKGGGGAVMKGCPICLEYCPASARYCFKCGHEFVMKLHIDGEASTLEVMTRTVQPDPVVELVDVERVTYYIHQRRNSTSPASLRVSYFIKGLLRKPFEEYICFEHSGAARTYAMRWWQERAPAELTEAVPVPDTTAQAAHYCDQLKIPKQIRVWVNSHPKPKVMSYEY